MRVAFTLLLSSAPVALTAGVADAYPLEVSVGRADDNELLLRRGEGVVAVDADRH